MAACSRGIVYKVGRSQPLHLRISEALTKLATHLTFMHMPFKPAQAAAWHGAPAQSCCSHANVDNDSKSMGAHSSPLRPLYGHAEQGAQEAFATDVIKGAICTRSSLPGQHCTVC